MNEVSATARTRFGALLLERLEQHQPLVGGLAEHHVAAACDHGGDAVGGQRRPDGIDPLDAGEQERDVARLDRLAVEGRAGAEQSRDVGGEVDGDVLAQGVDADGAVAAGGEVLRPELPHPQWGGSRSPGQPAVLVVRLDVEDGDARVAQLGAAAQLLQRVDQGRVAAPVGGECPAGRSRAGRLQVGDDVAPAEGVDGLLGVTDQDQRRVAGEGAVEDVPLHRVGVLELVDQDHLPALAHPLACRCVLVLECVGEPAEQVVVRQDAAAVLAPLHLVAHRLGEVDLGPRDASRLGVLRCELGLRVADRCPGQLQGDGALERRWLRVRAVLPRGRGRRSPRPPARRGCPRAPRASRCHRPRRGSAAPAGRTGGWSRSSLRRSRPARR